MRTHTAGSLRASQVGEQVALTGWVAHRRDHGGVVFLDLRDASGVVQVVIRDVEAAHRLRAEFCLRVVGEVARRPAGNENPELETGEVEVLAQEVETLSEAAPLPFPVADSAGDRGGDRAGDRGGDVAEEVRLRYRYLDLRRERPARALRLRAQVTRIIRAVMDAAGFLDIETPYLTRSTPEGARDFLVPVRLQPGTWYALPQSPQLFKQLLMVAGMERYYQIVRCFRDEDFRADRQPEFTQLDVEMSFLDEEDVLALSQELMVRLWREVLGIELSTPFPRLTYAEAMAHYGSDKPDVRFGVELVDLSSYFAGTAFRVFSAPYVGAVVMPGGAAQTRRELDGWQDWAKARGARGLAYVLFDLATGEPRGPLAKNLSVAELSGLADATGARPGDAVFFAAGEQRTSQELLGAARLEIGRRCDLVDASRWEFRWVVEAPLFERTDDGGWTAVHHPFTAPMPEWEERFAEEPDAALARAYDLVLNGTEVGGGSIRIHRAEVQQRVFDVIGLTKAQAEDKFGFLLEAFRYGPPPHGGIAFGLDRLVALLGGFDSIREVIAFPKTSSGSDPLTGAPTPITPAQRKEAGVDAPPPSTAHTPLPNEPGLQMRADTRRN